MIVYDGTYRFQPEPEAPSLPRRQWACAWQIRIINLDLSQPDVRHLKPVIVVANQSGVPASLTSCAESIGKNISHDFNLDISRFLWIELFPGNLKKWFVAAFKPQSSFGPDISYHIDWRPIRPNEIDILQPFLPEVGNSS